MTETRNWFRDRFVPYTAGIEHACKFCGRSYWLPKSKSGKYTTCGSECAAKLRQQSKESRKRFCASCSKEFYPRLVQLRDGRGVYCSRQCNGNAMRGTHMTEEVRKKTSEGIRRAIDEGRFVHKTGEDHPRWKGGRKESVRRQIADGRANAQLKRYRAENPEKVREWAQSRNRRKYGRLPRGTVKQLSVLQQGKCAICRRSLDAGFHVDHIIPLALGGSHTKRNIQLLCASCNVRKSAKHPIDFMQERGFLL